MCYGVHYGARAQAKTEGGWQSLRTERRERRGRCRLEVWMACGIDITVSLASRRLGI